MDRRVEDLVVKERTIKMGLKLSEEQDQSTIQINQNSAHFEEDDTPSSGLDDLGSSSGSCEDEKLETDPREETAKEAGSSHLVPETTINSSGSSSCKAGGGTKLRRPEKPVPCPRCNSIDTKFCYFNNYNINQPRHFCKNCQRYWTAGGTLRNVPVGAGRRKSKHNSGSSSNSQQEHCTVLVEAGAQSSLKRNASPSAVAEASNVFAAKTEIIPSGSIDNMQDGPCSSSEVTTDCSGSTEGKTSTNPPPLPSSFPWPYGLPAAANNMPSNIPGEMAAWLNGVWAGMPPWAPLWGPSVWNTQWGAAAAAATFAAAAASNPFQKYSGKHSRGENASGGEGGRVDGCLWAPKTLRMDHPGEAAKSSIWATLGLDKAAPSSGGAFRSCRTAVIRQEVERREKDEDEEEEEVKLEEEKKQEEE